MYGGRWVMADGVARLRGRIAEVGVKHHVVASEMGMHYTQLSRILNERQAMPDGFEERLNSALDRLEAAERAAAEARARVLADMEETG